MTTTRTADERQVNALAFRPFRYLWLTNLTFFLVSNAQRFVVFTLGLPAAFLVLQAGAWGG